MRVLIAEHQSKVRFALRVTIERQPGLKSVSEVVDARELLSHAELMCPDLVLVDWELPGMDAGETLRSLHDACPHSFLIALSGTEEGRQSALQAGADVSVGKGDSPDQLLAAIGEYSNRWHDKTK